MLSAVCTFNTFNQSLASGESGLQVNRELRFMLDLAKKMGMKYYMLRGKRTFCHVYLGGALLYFISSDYIECVSSRVRSS